MSDLPEIRGTVHGKTIELEQDAGFPAGQPVSVVVRPLSAASAPGDGLRQAFGAWADNADDLDEYLAWSRRQRKATRSSCGP